MPKMNLLEAIRSTLDQEMKRDKSIIILGEDVGENGGVFRVTEGLAKKHGNNRVMDTPLAESAILGVSIGMALQGLKPIPEVQFEGFLYPAMDQLINHAARYRNRTRGVHSVPLVLRCPIGGGIKALEHHSDSPEAILAHSPGLKVVMPSNPYDAKGLMASAIEDPDPVIFFEPKKLYRSVEEDIPTKRYTVPIGKANVVKEGTDLTLISYGSLLVDCFEIASQFKEANIEVIDLRTISPLDTETIVKSVQKTGRVVIVNEAPRSGGIASEITARINDFCLFSLKAPIQRVTGFDTVVPLRLYEHNFFPSKSRIINAIHLALK